MLKKIYRRMLLAQILSAVTVSLCLLIDNRMIGNYLGEEAMAAYGFANPVLLVFGALGSMLAAGVQVACSRSIGNGNQRETNSTFASAIMVAVTAGVGGMMLILFLKDPLASLLGAGKEGNLHRLTADYLSGFVIGVPATLGALILVPFLQIAGKSNRLALAVGAMTVSDVALDFLFAVVMDLGMFGMGLASALSYYIALLVGCGYFLSKKCMFRFERILVTGRKIRELFVSGLPTVFTMASTVILTFVLNRVLLAAGTSVAVAAYSVISTVGNISYSISTGVGGVTLTMSGVFFNEEDPANLKRMFQRMLISALLLNGAALLLLLFFAPACASFFLPQAGETQDLAAIGIRLFALSLVPCGINTALKNFYQGTEKVRLTEIISLCQGAILPAVSAILFSHLLPLRWIWFCFPAGEILALLGIVLYSFGKTKKLSLKSIMMLPTSLHNADEDLLEVILDRKTDPEEVRREVEKFCLSRIQYKKELKRLELCMEEISSIILSHDFMKHPEREISIRLLYKHPGWVVRFRDNGIKNNPMASGNALTEDPGIQIVTHYAREIRYTYSMDLNNLTLYID